MEEMEEELKGKEEREASEKGGGGGEGPTSLEGWSVSHRKSLNHIRSIFELAGYEKSRP